MRIEIFEEKQNKQVGINNWQDLMTDEEYSKGQYYNNLYLVRQAEIAENKSDWDRLWELYNCKRDIFSDDPDYPNNFIPLLTPCIEGQVASIIEGDIEITHVTSNPAHQRYMPQYDAASDYIRRKNKFIDYFKDFTRAYDLLGNSAIAITWEDSLSVVKGKPVGFPRLILVPLMSFIVDGRIKDAKDLQYAEYIIHEIGFQSIAWAKNEYGDDKASALALGYARYDGENPTQAYDDQFAFTLLHVWTRNNPKHNLQLIEMDSNGFVLRMSDPDKPYYKYVENEYPFYFSRMIPNIGEFYGRGDGMILKPMQETVNNLADELEMAARYSAQGKVVVDPRGKMGGEQLTSNPADIAFCINPNENIKVLQGVGINPVVVTMIQFLLTESQKATRFNEIMTGNQQGVSATATQINSQLMQGSVGINDKKSDISRAMEYVDRYCLKLGLEYWDKPFWSTIGYNYSASNDEFVDPVDMRKAPTAIPISTTKQQKMEKKSLFRNLFNFGKTKTDLVRDENNQLVYIDVDFDTKVFIGKGIARGKTDMYNILQGLARTILMTPDGRQRGAISPERWIELMEQTLGMKLSDENMMALPQASGFDVAANNGINPVGNNNTIQMPQGAVPQGLMQNVPQQPGADNRNTVI